MKKSDRPPIPPKMEMLAAKGTFEQRCNWNKVAKEYQRAMKWALRKSKADTLMDLSEPMLARRMQVAVDYTDRIVERYKHIPGLEESHRDETGDAWLYFNFQPSITYNMLEARSHILRAATIWILDQITAQPDWKQKLYPLLPQDFAQLAEAHAPDLWSPNYDLEQILSVMYVLYSRNADIAPTEIDDDSVERIWTNDFVAKGEQHKNVPSRCAFETLISLIPQEAIQRACAAFESLLWAWIDRYFACIAPMKAAVRKTIEEANKLARQYNKLREELTEAADDAYRKRTGPEPEGVRKKPAINPLMADPNSVINEMLSGNFVPSSPLASSTLDMFRFEEEPVHRVLRLANQMSDIEDRHEDLCETYDELVDDQKGFTRDMALDGCIPQEACREDYGDDVAEHMVPLAISDPYEICFALLWLLENDCDLPWLYGPGCGLMLEVAQCLPWDVTEHDKKEEALEE